MTDPETTRRNIAFPGDLWDRIAKARGQHMAETGEQVSQAEWIRDACERKLAAQHKGERR